MTDTTIVLQKLTTLREHLARVTRRRPANAAALRGDVDLQDALALSLLVAIQKAVDSAFHITADEGWGVPSSYGEGALPKNSDCALGASVMPAKAGIQAGRLRGCLVDSRFRGNDEFGTQLSSWAKPVEGFDVLARHAVIDAGLAKELGAASALRNRIAHGYAAVDLEGLWTELPAGIGALERYAAAIARFLPPAGA